MGTSLLKSSLKEHKQRKEVSQQAKDRTTVAPESYLAKLSPDGSMALFSGSQIQDSIYSIRKPLVT